MKQKPLNDKVLIVEDSYVNRKHLTIMLDHWNVEYDEALNGNEAIYLASINKYSVILMDIQLPEVNGYQATKWIKTKSRYNLATPVIGISSLVNTGDFDESKKSDFYLVLPKPCEASTLFDLLCDLKIEIPISI